jgi:hypothetical protein
VWTRIGGFITTPADLATLASISARAMSAAADLTRFPLVENFRLVDVIASGPVEPIPETTESTDHEDIQKYFYQLGCAKFRAVKDGRHINVELGQEPDLRYGSGGYCRKKLFEVQSYLTADPGFMSSESLLYVMELDDDSSKAS